VFVGAGATRDLVLLSLSRRGLSAFESRVQFKHARVIGTRRGVAWYAREEVQVWVVWCDKAWCGVVGTWLSAAMFRLHPCHEVSVMETPCCVSPHGVVGTAFGNRVQCWRCASNTSQILHASCIRQNSFIRIQHLYGSIHRASLPSMFISKPPLAIPPPMQKRQCQKTPR
jgi:hypothetical protein